MEEGKENDDAAREQPEHEHKQEDGDSGPQAIAVAPIASAASGHATTRDSRSGGDANDDAHSHHSHDSSSDATLSSRGARFNPFDPRVSFKNPFPKFEDSLAGFRADHGDENAESDGDNDASTLLNPSSSTAAVNLDWSIDTLAELKPMAFSPLSEQKTPGGGYSLDDTTEITPNSIANNAKFDQFFDDEAQYKVLQTPSPLIRQQEQEQQNQFQYLQQSQRRQQQPRHSSASPLTPGPPPPPRAPTPPSITYHSASRRSGIPGCLSTSSSDLHRRCQDAIAFCEDRVRERQRKLSRLQLPQSWSSSSSPATHKNSKKNKNKRLRGDASEFPWKTSPQQRASELRGIHPRTPASVSGTPGTQGFRPSQSPFSVPLTPIDSADQMLRTPERNPKAAAERKSMQNEPEFSFDGGSPISPIAPFPGSEDRSGSTSTLLDKTIREEGEYEEEGEEEKEGASQEQDSASLSPIPRRVPAKDAPSFGSLSFSASDEEHDKENRKRQQPNTRTKTNAAVQGSASASSSSPSFSLSSSWGKAAEDAFSLKTLARLQSSAGSSGLSSISFASSLSSPPAAAHPVPGSHSHSSPRSDSHSGPRSRSQAAAVTRSDKMLASPSIAQRQESFMAAIEAEARACAPPANPQTSSFSSSSFTSTSTSSSNSSYYTSSNAVPIAELFQEARALGISEPRAQWEYVQLLKKQRGVGGKM